MSRSDPEYCTTYRIDGMTCASCELLLELRLKAVPGIKNVDIDHKTGLARISADPRHAPDRDRIEAVVRKAGYVLSDDPLPVAAVADPARRKWLEIGGSLLVIFALFKLIQTFDLVSLAPSTSGALSLGGVLIIGLVAGMSSCLAVTGGLLLALAAKHNEMHQAETAWQKFKPLLHFNMGRLASYFVLGGLVGVLGRSITLSTRTTGYLNIIIAVAMLYLALSILQIIPKGSFPIRPPKRLSRRIAGLSESEHPAAPLALGALTFFLPCGFTQSLQLVALASGSFLSGALTMFIFALGTLPALLSISAVSSAARGVSFRLFLRFAGTLVFFLALFNLNNGFALAGINLASAPSQSAPTGVLSPQMSVNAQVVDMKVTPSGYEPSNLTIRAGVPVQWNVDGTGAVGCASILTIPSLGITKDLGKGPNVIEFTAPQPGPLAFMCSMGMVRGYFTVI
jgi:sulfite exporter TauE/SafE/copper chaperone CopZ